MAFVYAVVEFAVPLIAVFITNDAPAAFVMTMATKTLLAIALTAASLVQAPVSDAPSGLGPRAFGINSSAWALTSVASGTGELALLGGAGLVALSGSYRIFQTIASLGSVVGFAALAPLMSKEGPGIRSLKRPMLILGGVSCLMLLAGMIPGLVLTTSAVGSDLLWAVSSATALALAAVLSTLAIVPLSAVAREVGAKYTFRVGLASSLCYWGIIGALALAGQPLFVALAPLAASIVGLLGNLWVWRRIRVL